MDGDSLEAALRDYGPAAMEDLLPRLRAIAEILDAAHASGQVHGRLHPQNIFVSADQTRVRGLAEATTEGEQPPRAPYSAPEIAAGGPAQPAADQFSLAAIAFEWMFGRRISGPAVRPIEVRALPGVDRDALARAFTRALAPQPADRFASCMAFCQALDAAVIPVLPLGGAVDEEDVLETGFRPEPVPSQPIDLDEIEPAPAAAPVLAHDAGRLESFEPRLSPPVEPVTSWQPSAAYTPAKVANSFSGGMLIASWVVGMVVGFAAGYMARPRALQTGPIQTMAVPSNGTDGAEMAVPPPMPGIRVEGTPPATPSTGLATATGTGPAAPPVTRAPRRSSPAARTAASRSEKPVATASGVLVVESRPPGAAVMIDGKPRGTTPLTVDAMAPGTYRVTLSLVGYQPFATTVRVVAGERARAAASLSVQE